MKSKIITYSAATSFIIIALSFAYYLVWYLPNKHKTEQELERQKIQSSQEQSRRAEQERLNRDAILVECQNELAEADLSGSESFVNDIDDAQKLLDTYIQNCMRRSGYSDF